MRNLTDAIHALGLEIGMYVTGGFEAVYGQEAAWARAVFTEWNFDGIKIDHMCGVPACNVPGARTSNIAAPFQGATMARWGQTSVRASIAFVPCVWCSFVAARRGAP
jgi:hypothetical protein